MARIVITGSTRGLGYALAHEFLRVGDVVTISGSHEKRLADAVERLSSFGNRRQGCLCDVRNPDDIRRLWDTASEQFGGVDLWINNAGINQPYENLWQITHNTIHTILSVNLEAAIQGSLVAMNKMLQQGYGAIYNVEGFGSNGMQRKGLNLYGTTKRALTYFTDALAKEATDTSIRVGILSPGMMVTDFLRGSDGTLMGDKDTEKIFNILGDKPETVARFLVERLKDNPPNGTHITWLTKKKAVFRFMKSRFVKRNLFD